MASQEWEKPKAVVIPKETGRLQKGKYGPIFPKTPACYGFTIIAKVKPGTAETIRNYGRWTDEQSETAQQLYAIRKSIDALASSSVQEKETAVSALRRLLPFSPCGSGP